jgi:hypothetical protein
MHYMARSSSTVILAHGGAAIRLFRGPATTTTMIYCSRLGPGLEAPKHSRFLWGIRLSIAQTDNGTLAWERRSQDRRVLNWPDVKFSSTSRKPSRTRGRRIFGGACQGAFASKRTCRSNRLAKAAQRLANLSRQQCDHSQSYFLIRNQ